MWGLCAKMWELAVAAIHLGTLAVFIVMALTWDISFIPDKNSPIKKINIMKIFFTLLVLWLIVPLLSLATNFAESNSASDSIKTLCNLFMTVDLYTNILVTSLVVLYLVINTIMALSTVFNREKE